LRQLTTVKKYKEAGVSLERIAQILHEERGDEPIGYRVRPGTVEVVSRIHLAEGVELQGNPERSGLTQAQIRRRSQERLALIDTIKKEEK
jgi:DNA-binding transcriptional MerR regulator